MQVSINTWAYQSFQLNRLSFVSSKNYYAMSDDLNRSPNRKSQKWGSWYFDSSRLKSGWCIRMCNASRTRSTWKDQVSKENIKILDRDLVGYSMGVWETVHIRIHCQTSTMVGGNTSYPTSGTSCWAICHDRLTWCSNLYYWRRPSDLVESFGKLLVYWNLHRDTWFKPKISIKRVR